MRKPSSPAASQDAPGDTNQSQVDQMDYPTESMPDGELTSLREQLANARERERRLQADYENLRRRVLEERAAISTLATTTLVTELLPVFDHLTLAADQIKDKGLSMVVSQLWNVLENEGLQRMIPEGEEYDVSSMEAVEKAGEGTKVVEVRAPGYRLKNQVLRPAKVVVG